MHAVRINEYGGPDALRWESVPDPVPGEGQVRVRVAAAGVNYIDSYHRRGAYPVDLPFVPGLEGAGVVDAIGDRVDCLRVGDRVAWVSAPGSYAELVLVEADQVVVVPQPIDLETAGGVLLQGMTAHYLVHDTFPLRHGDTCLVHAGAGGVGHLLIQMAVHTGARVFATAGTPEKRKVVSRLGADFTCGYEDFVGEIEREAGARPLDVIFDGVGRDTYVRGLRLIRSRGMAVLFGQSSGPVPPFDLQELNRNGSLFTTRPSIFHHVATSEDLHRRAADVFSAIDKGWLRVAIGTRYEMPDASAAHAALENRRTIGKVILVPPRRA
jgi:NADPH2:quinone reductase